MEAEEKELKSIHKLMPVIRVMFSTAGKRYPWFFVLEALKTLVQIAQPFVGIFVTPLLVDELCTSRNIRTLIIYAAVLVVGESALLLLNERLDMTLQKYQERLNNYFGMQMGLHSMGLDFQLTEDKAALDQLEKAKTGMDWYSGGAYGIAEQVFKFAGNVFKIAGFVTLITLHAPFLLIVILAYILMNAVVTSRRNGIELQAYHGLSRINRLFGYFGWNIVNFEYGKDIRLYDARKMMVTRWQKNSDESNAIWKWQADSSYVYALFSEMAALLRTLITYFYVGLLVIRGAFSVGVFTQMISAASALDATLGGLVWNIQELMKRCNYAYEYVLFMQYPEALPKGDKPVEKREHRIEFRNVSFAYPGTDRKVLDGVNITIEPGEHLSIVGLNGAGKTTFIKLLCRLYDPTEGEILLDGCDIREYRYKEYMEQFAPVFQDFKLFAFSIAENITFQEGTNADLEELLHLVELDGTVEKLEQGVDTRLFKLFEEAGVEPSGGEQQKLAIARALYKQAPVVILDEPTAALDPIAEYEIYRQFHTLVGNKTAFYISHRLSSCRFCDCIAVFSEGKIAEYGSHEELSAIPNGIYAKMFEAQAQYYR
ncbi:MAG: ABC transporter ATP-binding protein/permease [Roseburia sp.]|nr:ABC transporter ATP-binding protein/permease [Roseburia sp.]